MTLEKLLKIAEKDGLTGKIKNDECHVTGGDFSLHNFQYKVVGFCGEGFAVYKGAYPKWEGGPIVKIFKIK